MPEPKGRHAFREFAMAYWNGERGAGRKITYKQALKEASTMWNPEKKKPTESSDEKKNILPEV